MMTIPRNDQILPIYVTTSALILLHRPLFFSFENNDLSMTIVSRPSLSYFNLLDKHIKTFILSLVHHYLMLNKISFLIVSINVPFKNVSSLILRSR